MIAATNRDLPKLVGEGKFREDLFYRLNVIPVEMPPLRDRAEDIPLIAEHFLAKYTREMSKAIDGFSPEALAALRAYPWPGNVRELENVVERAVALESERRVELATLPENLREGRPATPRPGQRRCRSPRPATASISNATSRTSSARISSARSSAPAACRRAPPTCWASASGSSAIW